MWRYIVNDNGEKFESPWVYLDGEFWLQPDILTFIRGTMFEGDWCPGAPYVIQVLCDEHPVDIYSSHNWI